MTSLATGAAKLLPLDLVCLEILKRFFNSCRKGRGGHLVDGTPWIRVTAEDMVGYLKRDGLEVAAKTVQRSLRRLWMLGKVRREQRFRARYDRRMWFAPVAPSNDPSPQPSEPTRKDTERPFFKSSPSNSDSSKVLAVEPPAKPERKVLRPINSLNSILARCLERGGYKSIDQVPKAESVSPTAIIGRNGVRLKINDGLTSPLR